MIDNALPEEKKSFKLFLLSTILKVNSSNEKIRDNILEGQSKVNKSTYQNNNILIPFLHTSPPSSHSSHGQSQPEESIG